VRLLRAASATAVVAASLAVPAVAAAAPSVSVAPTGQLGPESATADVFVTASCDLGATVPVIQVTIAQSTGNRLLQGSGGAGSTFGGSPIVCDGTPQLVPITVRPNPVSGVALRPFKQGGAAITATVSESGPSGFLSASVGPLEIRLKR
jgi:hypothetical protein